MKKNSFIFMAETLLLIFFVSSCNFNLDQNQINNGSISFTLPERTAGTSLTDNVLPDSYYIKVENINSNFIKDGYYDAGENITIKNIMPGDYEIVLKGETDYYSFEGKTNVTVKANRESNAEIELVKFRKPLYVNSNSAETGIGTKSSPFNTINKAIELAKSVENAIIYIDGNFKESINIDESSNLKNLKLIKNPDAKDTPVINTPDDFRPGSEKKLPALSLSNNKVDLTIDGINFNATGEIQEPVCGTILILNGRCELLNSSVMVNDDVKYVSSSIVVNPEAEIKLGGTTKVDIDSDISLKPSERGNDISPIIISKPLTEQFVANIDISSNQEPGTQLLKAEKNVDISNIAKKFKIDSYTNEYCILKDGTIGINKTVNLILNNANKNYDYMLHVKKDNKELWTCSIHTGTENKQKIKLSNGLSDYYFENGAICTVDIYSSKDDGEKFITSGSVTVSESGQNEIVFNLNSYYVKADGSDTLNDGLSESTAFATLNKAIEKIGPDNEPRSITVVGNIKTDNPINLETGKSPINLTITGKNGTITSTGNSFLTIDNRGSVTLANITVNGNITVGNTAAGTLNLKEGAVTGSNNTVTVNSSGNINMESSAQAGNIILNGDNTTVNVTGILSEANAGTVTIEAPTDNRTIVTGDAGNIDKFSFKFNETDELNYGVTSAGKIGGVNTNDIYGILNKHSGKEIKLRVEVEDFNDISGKLSGAPATVTLELKTTLTEIPSNALANSDNVKSLIIPEGIISIGKYAFGSMGNLENVTFPDSLTTINNEAFKSCSKLSTISIGKNVKTIPPSAFANTGITTANLKGVTTIDTAAFTSCPNLTTVTAPALENIGDNAFYQCAQLTNIPESVRTIGKNAFYCCGITNLNLPNLTTLDYGSFYGCSKLATVTTLGNLTTLPEGVFENCLNLTELVIPDTVTSVVDNLGTSGITTLTMPCNLSFSGNKKLTTVTLKTTTTSGTKIIENALKGCEKLTNVTIQNGITEIGANAFANTGITTADLKDVTTIDTAAFTSCSKLTTVTAPALENIGENAFYQCAQLTDVTLKSGSKWFLTPGNTTYNDASNSTNNANELKTNKFNQKWTAFISLAEAVKQIQKNNSGSDLLCTVLIETNEDFTTIGTEIKNMKTGTVSLITLATSSNVTTIPARSFQDCTKLKFIKFPETLTSIEDTAFRDCTSLSIDSLPASLTTIQAQAFLYVPKITNGKGILTIPDNVTSIGDSAFANDNHQSDILEIKFGENSKLTNIGVNAFGGNMNLKTVTFPNSLKTVGACAFNYCGRDNTTEPKFTVIVPAGSEWSYTMNGQTQVVTEMNDPAEAGEWLSTVDRFNPNRDQTTLTRTK